MEIVKELYQVGDEPGGLTIPKIIRESWGFPQKVKIIILTDHIEVWPHKNSDPKPSQGA